MEQVLDLFRRLHYRKKLQVCYLLSFFTPNSYTVYLWCAFTSAWWQSRKKCAGFFDFSCHIQYICISWMLLFGLFLAIFPTGTLLVAQFIFLKHEDSPSTLLISNMFRDAAVVLLWLLHEKGLFDPIYDWWEDHIWASEERDLYVRKHERDALERVHRHDIRHQHYKREKKRSNHVEHRHRSRAEEGDYHYYLHQVHKDRHKHRRLKSSSILEQEDRATRHHRRHGKRDKIHRRYEPRWLFKEKKKCPNGFVLC